jgi:tRNA dimethylallyltransferase
MKVVFVVGPTASGKSALAFSWAQEFGGAIINCDSIQVFKSLDIGSAKPSVAERQLVPHFLFDYVDEGKEITAGEYSRDFFKTLEQIKDRFPIVFVVGGTGFYFQAIEKGMYPIGAADPEIIKQVEGELQTAGGPEDLHRELSERDPKAAAKISLNDHYRIARAVEMMRTHGRPVSEIKEEFESKREPFPYPLLKIGVKASKEELLPRIELRTQKMLQQGLLKEVESLSQRGLQTWAPLQSIGYHEAIQFLKSEIPDERSLKDLIVQNTMRLAKKQRTWFQRDPEIFWISLKEELLAREKIKSLIYRP